MDLGTILFIAAFLWFLFSEVRPKKKPERPQVPGERPRPTPVASRDRPVEARTYGPAVPAPRYDTQTEARRLERLLKGLDPDVVEIEVPRPAPQVISLEDPVERAAREATAYDDAAGALVSRRIRDAAARDRALDAADHARFDERIRRPARQRDARLPPRMRELRRAIIWREVLGPPVSLRDGS